MRHVPGFAWRFALLGALVVVGGFAAIIAASIQGQALQPDSSILDGYWVGLLPWMEVGTWLVPLGGLAATIGGLVAIWFGRPGLLARLATLPALVVVLFWVLLVAIGMAPRYGPVPDSSPTSSSLATVVYSSPANTIFFLLVPTAVVVLLAAAARRRTA